jgi:prolyl oligopeptidase
MPSDASLDGLDDFDDVDSPRSRALVTAGNAEVERRLYDAEFEADRARLRAVLEDDDKLFVCRRRGSHLYDFHRNAQHPRGLWRRLAADLPPGPHADWESVFDLDAYCRETDREWAWRGVVEGPDGGRVLLMLSDNGSDVMVAREFDLGAKAFVVGGFETPPCRQHVGWDAPDRLLVCAATTERHAVRSGWPRTVRAWERGMDLADAPVIHESGWDDVGAGAERLEGEEGGTLVLATLHTIKTSTFAVETGGRRDTLDLPRASDKRLDDRFVAWQPQEDGAHPAGAVVLRSFRGPALERVLVRPSARGAVSDVLLSRDWLVAVGHEELVPWLRVLDLRAPEGEMREVPLPEGVTGAWPFWRTADPWRDGPLGQDARLDVVVEGMLRPSTLLSIDLADPAWRLAEVGRAKPSFDAAGMDARLLSATSADGTDVPYHLALPREAAQGPVPVVVTAYGGYEVSVPAGYLRLHGPVLLEKGIGLAVAHIRGGGEFGPAWHRSAVREKRPRSFEDCAAVAHDLVGRGTAPQGGVGFVGGSNGGLLACVMATRYPDAFGAIKADVPVTDMLRFHRYEAGAAWIEEYGDPDDPTHAAFLRAYSPLHQVRLRSEIAYPPVLIDAPAHDDRVAPAHARRLAQAMRDAGQDVLLRTSLTGGHGGGETSDRQALDMAVEAAFFRRTLASA